MTPSPSPLLQDWITIPGFLWLVLGCIAATVVGIVISNLIRVWHETGDAMDAFLESEKDDRLALDVARYHCAGNGHYYGAHPEVFNDCDVWTCKNCGHEAPVMHGGRKPFDQASA